MSADQLHYVVHDGHISTKFKLKLSHTTFWAVLVRESAAGPKRISFYNTQAEFVTGLQPQFFLELRNILRVQQVETKVRTQRPYQFKIISTSSTQLCATKTAEECQKWVKNMTDLMQGIPEPNVVYEFQIFVQPGGHAEQLKLSGLYILKVFDSYLQLYSASGAFPTDFHCSLANATVFCTATNIRESEAGMLMIQTSSNADIGEGELAFSAKSAIDFTRVVEHRRLCMPKNEATTQRSLSLSTRPSSCSKNISPDPKLLADVSQLQCPNPMKSPRQSAPVFPGHALDFHDSAPGSDKSSMQPKSLRQPSSTTLPKNWKTIPLPKPWSKPASPNPSQGRPLSPQPDMKLSGAHSNGQISTNKATPPTLKSLSNFLKVLLPVPHHKKAHASKSDLEDTTNSSLPSAASPIKVARLTPKEQAKAKKCSDSERKSANEGSKNEAARKRFMYLNKSTGDLGDYEINDIGIGNGKSSCRVKKNTACGVVEMGLGDESSPVVGSSGCEYIDMGIGNGPIANAYLDVVFDKPPTTVEESSACDYEYVEMGIGNENPLAIVEKSIVGESGDCDYVDVEPPFTVKSNVIGKSALDLQALQQKESISDKHPALVGLQANGPQMTRDTATSNNNSPGVCVMENLKEDQSVGNTELSKKAHHKKQGSPCPPPLPPRPPPPASQPKKY